MEQIMSFVYAFELNKAYSLDFNKLKSYFSILTGNFMQ